MRELIRQGDDLGGLSDDREGRLADVQYSKCALFLISWTRATGSEAPTLNTGSKDHFGVPHDAPVVSRPA